MTEQNVLIVDDKPQFVRGPPAVDCHPSTSGGGKENGAQENSPAGSGPNRSRDGQCIKVGEYRVPLISIDHLVEAMPCSEPRKRIARQALQEAEAASVQFFAWCGADKVDVNSTEASQQRKKILRQVRDVKDPPTRKRSIRGEVREYKAIVFGVVRSYFKGAMASRAPGRRTCGI